MSDNREKIRSAFALAENYSWIFYLVILALLIPFRLGWIEAQESIIDFIIAISIISITAQAVNKLKNRDNDHKPFIRCLKCHAKIDSVGVWQCKNIVNGKMCGWTATFPDDN